MHWLIKTFTLGSFTVAWLLSVNLCHHDFFHLLDWHCTLDIHPFVLNHMLLFELEHEIDASDISVCHEAEASRLIGPLVLQDHAVFNVSEVLEVGLKLRLPQVMWEATDEDLT